MMTKNQITVILIYNMSYSSLNNEKIIIILCLFFNITLKILIHGIEIDK
jgi:hypothetical protein